MRSFPSSFTRYRLLSVVTLLLSLALSAHAHSQNQNQSQPAQIIDLRGRTVVLDRPVKRIAIDDGRFLVALSLIHEHPVDVLAAWPQDINRVGEHTHAQLLEKYPQLKDVPRIPSSAQPFNVEAVLSAAPDVAVVSAGSGPTDAQVAQLESGGIKVIFIDFFTSPFENLEPSLRILGQLTGAQAKAEEFIAFRHEHMQRIAERVSTLAPEQRPTVFLEAHAGMTSDCCNAPGRGNIGDYIEFVGGHNIGADAINQAFGRLSLEYVMSRDPDIYIATGGPHLERAGGLVLGPGYTDRQIQDSLQKIAGRTGIAFLSAVSSGRTHGYSHQLINSPVDIVVIEVFAKWVHPELFEDVDPEQTLQELNDRFLQVPYHGTFWTSLEK